MNSPQIITSILSFLAIVPTLASLTKFDHWWIRGFDFPRLQVASITLLVFIAVFIEFPYGSTWQITWGFLLIMSFGYQSFKIFPYTYLARKQVIRTRESDPEASISLLVSNVLTPNQEYYKLLDLVKKWDPDILLTLESDLVWQNRLSEIEKTHPYTVKIPQDNLYGMHLYSRLELEEIQIKYLVTPEIPSIHGYVRLRNGALVNIHCLHPKPPSPTEDDTSTNRDAELLQVGKKVKGQDATLVFGDLNDVAWSRTTLLFQQISGLLDPRIGRGFYNTYNANIPVFRWPLDHVFHSKDFSLVKLQRLPHIGSDHFPIYIKLTQHQASETLNDEPDPADQEEKEWVDEKIEKGR